MTISKSAWHSFLRRYRRCIQPDPETGVTARDIELAVGIQLVAEDILGRMRGTSISFFELADGTARCSTCREFLDRVFFDVFDVLERTGVEVYVVSIDAYGRRPEEKMATSLERSKRARPEEAPDMLPLPRGQNFYFLDSRPMPGPVNMIFETPAAKREFYVYMTLYWTLDVRERIPPGKRVILSGGAMELNDDFMVMPPLEITRDGWEIRHEWDSPQIGEGDIDVWNWVYRFPDMNFHVCSHDADVVLIGMLQMRRLLKKSPARRGWAVTRRSIETHAIDERYKANLAKRHCLRKKTYDAVLKETQDPAQAYVAAGGSFASSSSAEPSDVRRPTWVYYHIDLVQVYQDIIKDARLHVEAEHKRAAPTTTTFPDEVGAELSAREATLAKQIKFCPNFVETYVLAFILASDKHDYIQTKLISRNVGTQHVWAAFEKRMYAFAGLVEVYKKDLLGDNRTFYYVVDKQVMSELVRAFYREKAEASIKEENKTYSQLVAAREKSYTKNIGGHGPSESEVWVVASQCAWLLQYWGNGPVPDYVSVRGADIDVDGNSVYGYTPKGWAKRVVEAGIKRVCPPLPPSAP